MYYIQQNYSRESPATTPKRHPYTLCICPNLQGFQGSFMVILSPSINPPQTTHNINYSQYTRIYHIMGVFKLEAVGKVTITQTPNVCRIMAFWAVLRRFGPLFYLLLSVGRGRRLFRIDCRGGLVLRFRV